MSPKRSNTASKAQSKGEPKLTPFERLLHDLQNKKTLCALKDYRGVTLVQLNLYLKAHGPLYNIQFGNLYEFCIDKRIDKELLLPMRKFSYENGLVASHIGANIGSWISCNPKFGGFGMAATGDYLKYEEQSETGESSVPGYNSRHVRIPDLAYVPRKIDKTLALKQRWIYQEEPFVPIFVVETNTLTGPKSELQHLDYKMREEYFKHGVKLGWLIDAKNKIMIEYSRTNDPTRIGEVDVSEDHSWRDLNGAEVLPGFLIKSVELDMQLDKDSGPSYEDELESPLVCPYPDCVFQTTSPAQHAGHAEEHRSEREIARYLRRKRARI